MDSEQSSVLYSFRRCPYAIRARMTLSYAGVPHQMIEVSLKNKPQALLTLSPKGTVPVLRCADGTVIEQSLDIMLWALQQNDPAGWLSGYESEIVQHLIACNDGPFKKWLDRYKYFERYPEQTQQEYRAQAEQALIALLEDRLSTTPFLCGNHPTIADVAIFPFVRQFAAVDANWFDASEWKETRRWLSAWIQSDLFKLIMDKTTSKRE